MLAELLEISVYLDASIARLFLAALVFEFVLKKIDALHVLGFSAAVCASPHLLVYFQLNLLSTCLFTANSK